MNEPIAPLPTLLPASLPDRKAYAAIGGITVLVIGFLFVLIYGHDPAGEPPGWVVRLPMLDALFNGLSATFVAAGVLAIRARRPRLHAGLIAAGLFFSALFLSIFFQKPGYHFRFDIVSR